MKENSERLPVLIGLLMLSVASLGLGGLIYSFARSDTVQEQTETSEDYAQENSPSEESDKSILVAPAPVEGGGGGMTGIDSNSETGIPTGTYSNPPSTVNSFEYPDLPEHNSSINDFDSSVERNRLSQQSLDATIPDYSSPSSSNNFNQTDDNSLIEPTEENSLIEIPDTDSDEQSTGITSLEESPFE